MWVITGPFVKSLQDEPVDSTLPKLLRPDNTYSFGRKDSHPLIAKDAKISKETCSFAVGPHSVEALNDLDNRPTLEIVNLPGAKKALEVIRPITSPERIGEPTSESQTSKQLVVSGGKQERLQDGDVIRFAGGKVLLNIKWEVVNVYVPPELASTFSKEDCASLGIKVVHTPDNRVTHHVTADFTPSLPLAASLLCMANFVTPEWLSELIRLGKLPRGKGSLEDHLVFPPFKTYVPAFGSTIPSQYKTKQVWLPKEERLHLFADLRFICFFEKAGRAESDLSDAIHQGNGDLEKFDITLGVEKFRRALTRSQAKEGKKTVIIADIDAMQLAVGKQQWQEYVAEANLFSLAILPPTKVVDAALEADASLLLKYPDPSTTATSIERPLATPSTLDTTTTSNGASVEPAPARRKLERLGTRPPPAAPVVDELSIQAAPTSGPPKRLVRLGTTRPPSRSTTPIVDELAIESKPRPRRALTRLADTRGSKMVTGVDDPSGILDAVPDLPPPRRRTPPPRVIDLTAPTPARSNKLKRLADEISVPPIGSLFSSSSAIGETIQEPPLKKFKALFESADPESQAMDSGPIEPSQTQAESQITQHNGKRPLGASTLDMLREEEEETPVMNETQATRRLKRRVPSGGPSPDDMMTEDQADVVMDDAMPPSKKRAVENVNAVERSSEAGPSDTAAIDSVKKGAPAGKPDTNQAFLKALASTKRGKRTEDEFDRDFNNLKISRPALEREHTAPEDELKVLADFGDDSGLRGNFMVVVEMDVPERRSRVNDPSPCDWGGVPNFKKFKKKVSNLTRKTVDLFATDQDFGIGSAYWKRDDSEDMSQDIVISEPQDSQFDSIPPSLARKRAARDMDDEDEDLFGSQAIRKSTRSRASSRAPSVGPPAKTTTTTSKKPVSASSSRSKLGSSNSTTAKGRAAAASTSKTRTTGRSKKETPLFLDSDIEEEVDELQSSTVPSQDVMELFDDDDDDDDETLKSTFNSKTKASTSRRAPSSRAASVVPAVAPAPTRASGRKASATTKAKKMPIMVIDDSDDEGGGFKGFG